MAATLANGGICPITGEANLSNEAVKSTLSCMLAAGMNDYSVSIHTLYCWSKLYYNQGQWAYRVGLPGKSGISGGIMVIVPNVMGIAAYSPPIDKSFNSGLSLVLYSSWLY